MMSGKEICAYRFFVTWNICNVFGVCVDKGYISSLLNTFQCLSTLQECFLSLKYLILTLHHIDEKTDYTREMLNTYKISISIHSNKHLIHFSKSMARILNNWYGRCLMFNVQCSIFQYQTKQTLDSNGMILSHYWW